MSASLSAADHEARVSSLYELRRNVRGLLELEPPGPYIRPVTAETLRFSEARFDLRSTFALQCVGQFDPTARLDDTVFEKVHLDRKGLAVRHRFVREKDEVTVTVEREPGAETRTWGEVLPPRDPPFEPEHPRLRRIAQHFPGLRLLTMPWLFDVAVGAVLQQRVSFAEAATQFGRLAQRFGRRTPFGLTFPNAERLGDASAPDLQACGVDAKRARTIVALARAQRFKPFLYDGTSGVKLRQRLDAVPGIGPWTVAMIAGFGLGDPDVVLTGDLHLPRLVGTALAGEPGADDARMLELLSPYAGQRFRVVRLIFCATFFAPELMKPLSAS